MSTVQEEEQVDCPLCMEQLEIDDINFFPCTCGYQICRFCWHRIRTDENGLCPACRKQYNEDPALYKPLTPEELQKIKSEKKQKDLQRKQKVSENRKHLASVRVVQKNLVFVVGLSPKLADPEILKRHEYFGKFGKILKVVVNNSTSYAGAQGPSASAYVTYYKSEDALRAIQAVNNVYVDGRTLKTSLGTTKYCSHFLRNSQCPKSDCMYLHELGDEEASFTKEEMTQGKHQEYELRLHEQLFGKDEKRKGSNQKLSSSPDQSSQVEVWPLSNLHSSEQRNSPLLHTHQHESGRNSSPSLTNCDQQLLVEQNFVSSNLKLSGPNDFENFSASTQQPLHTTLENEHLWNQSKTDSIFSASPPLRKTENTPPIVAEDMRSRNSPSLQPPPGLQHPHIPTSSKTGAQAHFGFKKPNEDSLGLDAWSAAQSSIALAQLIEKTTGVNPYERGCAGMRIPPGFTPPPVSGIPRTQPVVCHQHKPYVSGYGPNLMQFPPSQQPLDWTFKETNMMSASSSNHLLSDHDPFNMKDWQDGLRALLPNINVSFGSTETAFTGPHHQRDNWNTHTKVPPQSPSVQQHSDNWLIEDPAIVSAGQLSQNSSLPIPSMIDAPKPWLGFLKNIP